MPEKPLKPCSKYGCPNLTRERYCKEHQQESKGYDRYRGTSTQRGYDHKWRAARNRYLAQHPLCKECFGAGRLNAATAVDHIVPHKGDKKLFWDKSNWQPLCASCHSRKTATEDGGFGNAR